MRRKRAGYQRGRFDGIKLWPLGLLFLLAGFARAFRRFGRDLTLDNGVLIIIVSLLLAVFLVGSAMLITRLRR
jgi:hypothetical protein